MGQEQPIAPARPTTMDTFQHDQIPSLDEAVKERSSKANKEVRQPFPCKVYEMLEDADDMGFSDVVSWNKEGNGFMVHNKDRFTKEIVPKYYNQTRYKSFQRQLSLYGFQRTTTGSTKGLRFHEKLRRGIKHFCREMKPVGYKPRGQENREKLRERKQVADMDIAKSHNIVSDDGGSSPVLTAKATPASEPTSLPAVVSSNSIYKENFSVGPTVIENLGFMAPVRPCTEITEKLITTDSIVLFEGMPFYLMTTKTAEMQQQHANSKFMPAPPVCVADTGNVDGQMKKAWEIGFAVAQSLNPISFASTPGVVTADALDFHTMGAQR